MEPSLGVPLLYQSTWVHVRVTKRVLEIIIHFDMMIFLFFVLCSYLGRSHHQADACQLASVYRGFCSIWNTHFCLRLQPHLYPFPVGTSVGRSDGTRQRYKSTHVEPDALVRTRNYCRIKVADSQRRTHIENPTRLNVIDPD